MGESATAASSPRSTSSSSPRLPADVPCNYDGFLRTEQKRKRIWECFNKMRGRKDRSRQPFLNQDIVFGRAIRLFLAMEVVTYSFQYSGLIMTCLLELPRCVFGTRLRQRAWPRRWDLAGGCHLNGLHHRWSAGPIGWNHSLGPDSWLCSQTPAHRPRCPSSYWRTGAWSPGIGLIVSLVTYLYLVWYFVLEIIKI